MKKHQIKLSVIFLLFFFSFSASAQKKDSVPTHRIHSPKKALLYSVCLPGLGQAYNHKYWKIPIIYAGLGTMAYFIVFDQQQYKSIVNALAIRENGGIDQYQVYTTPELVTVRDQWHYYRDLSVIGAAFVYMLNLLDAEVDAQFYSFNVNDNISARFTPSLNTYATSGRMNMAPGVSFVMKLK